jgi:hypothetical protein
MSKRPRALAPSSEVSMQGPSMMGRQWARRLPGVSRSGKRAGLKWLIPRARLLRHLLAVDNVELVAGAKDRRTFYNLSGV